MADVSQIELNGTTYDICDATARDSLSQYVLKTGDTMTGELIRKHSNIDIDNTPESNQYGYNLMAKDKNGNTVWYSQVYQNTANEYGIINFASKRWDNTNHYAGFSAGFNVNNESTVDIRGDNVAFGNGETAILKAKTPSRTGEILWAGGGVYAPGDANGTVVGLGGGGLTIIGGGEYGNRTNGRYSLADLNDGAESLYLGADSTVFVETNANAIANRKTFEFRATGTLKAPASIIATAENLNCAATSFPTDQKADLWGAGYYIHDKDEKDWGYIRPIWRTTNKRDLQIAVFNASGQSNAIQLSITPNNTKSYWVSDAAAFRSAIGLITSTTSTVSQIITAASGITITAADYICYDKIAQLYISFTRNVATNVGADGNATNFDIGTLVTGKRPAKGAAWHSNGDSAGPAMGTINPAGKVVLGSLGGTGSARTVAAGTTMQVYATYILP